MMNDDPNTLRMVVVFLRFYARMTQVELGRASGVEQALISRYESGHQPPPEESVRRMALAVGVPWALLTHLRRFYASMFKLLAQPADSADSLGGMLDRIMAAMASHVAETLVFEINATRTPEEERREAETIWTSLQSFPRSRWRSLLQLAQGANPSWALAERICEAGRRELAADPRKALELAELALGIAGQVKEEGWRSRVQGYCWAHVSHACRALGDDAKADEALARGLGFWRAGAEADPDGLLEESRFLEP